jgi:hypothetical protein
MWILTMCARAMFRRHNDVQANRVEWEELTPKAQAGYLEDARTCMRVYTQEVLNRLIRVEGKK